jgi:UDP-glucose 4-epimerase
MKKVLVLGATGNLGAYSALALKKAGFDVVAAGKREKDNNFFEDRGIPYFSVDITDAESFNCLMDLGIDTVADFAGELPSRCAFNPQKLIRTITEATVNVLEFMRKSGSKKIIFPTTPYDLFHLHETGEPIDPDAPRSYPATGDHSIYAIAKNAAVDLIENYHNEYGISRFILRFFTIYQYHPNAYHYADGKMRKMPYRGLIDKAKSGEPISIYGNPDRVKEMVYIKDFTKVVVAAAESELEGGFYNIGSPTRVSLDEMIHGIVEVFSNPDSKSEITYDSSKPDTLQSLLDWTKTTRDLGYLPEYDFITMMKDFKKEMEEEPFEQLWNNGQYYEDLYSSKV